MNFNTYKFDGCKNIGSSSSDMLKPYLYEHEYVADNYERYKPTYSSSTSRRSQSIESIEKVISAKKKNFIEFVGDKKKSDYVSNYKPKCSEPKKTYTRNSKFDGGEVLMIKNSNVVDGVDKTIYDAIIEVISAKELKPNERYALLQAFYHIDVVPMMVNIYIDKFILAKAGLYEDNLYKDEITNKIKEKIKDENLVVTFSDLKAVNLLNYYLK